MNYIRDNEIARKIISGEIKELYCVREKYCDNFPQRHIYARKHTIGKKYKVWADQMGGMWFNSSKNIHTGEFENCYVLRIETDNSASYITLESNSPISDYFETSIKKIRKNKLDNIRNSSRNGDT